MDSYKRLFKYASPYFMRFFCALILMIFMSGSMSTIILMVKPFIDLVAIEKDYSTLWILPFVFIGASIILGLSSFTSSYFMKYIGYIVITNIRKELYEHVLFLPVNFFMGKTTGELTSRVMNDIEMMRDMISRELADFLQGIFKMIGLIGIVFYLDWRLAVISLTVFPFVSVPIVKFAKGLKKVSLKSRIKIADMSTMLIETISSIRIVKAFGMETFESERFNRANKRNFDLNLKAATIMSLSSPLIETLGYFSGAIVIWYCGYLIQQGIMTLGSFLTFIIAVTQMYQPIKNITRVNNSIHQGLAAADRVFQILDEKKETERTQSSFKLQSFMHSIKFENVSFKYEDKFILKNINLTINAGEILAIVGSSGAGKTTIVNLLLRFYEPTKGRILVDGFDIKDASFDSLRSQISMVTQEIILFNDSIRNNIAYGRKDIPAENVIEAAQSAYAHEFIVEFPMHYDTNISDRGMRLSGGQQQRIAIARAILKNSPILILDEATSSLDTQSEHKVQKALFNLIKNKTCLVIAHRLSTIQHANRIIVLSEGKIIEEGSHEELLALNGTYKNLYELQFKKPISDLEAAQKMNWNSNTLNHD
ncbi:ATP-binding cassette domain-containing protein [bacterium]|nr:ATP-binding cassette domain-containing protein [bacterium]